MKNYRVGFKKGGNVTDASVGPWKEKQKPKPSPKDLEKLKKGRDFMEDPYRRKGRDPSREGREGRKPDPRAPSRPKKTWPPKHSDLLKRYPKMPQPHKSRGDKPYIPMPKHDPNEPKKWQEAAEGGRIGFKKGGTDKNWIQKATKGMVKTKPCTGRKFGSKSCPPGSRRYNLAKTFKKMGRERKAKA